MRSELLSDRGDRLRSWVAADAAAVLTAFDDPSMANQIGEPLTSVDDAHGWIDERRTQWEAGTAFSWAVEDESSILGSVTVSSIDRRHLLGWISYWTTGSARGRGVASSALRSVTSWAFDDLGLFRLELGHRTDNPASRRVAVAAGFSSEGIEREKLRYDDARYDVETHARLATDPTPV